MIDEATLANTDVVTIITVYDHPSDFPFHFVVRAWYVSKDGTAHPDESCWLYQTIEDVREAIPHWMICMPRSENDDPAILETWV